MKTLILFCVLLILADNAKAQMQDTKTLHENGRALMRQGDYANAGLVLLKALQQEPSNIEIAKDLALDYYFAKEYSKALETIKPLIDKGDADDQCFQIAGNIYKALGDVKECEKLYKKGIKKFANSGALYNEYGELLLSNRDNSNAIKQWERGIEMDADYSGNYYNACKFYYLTSDKVWSIIYGEIFLNIEPFTGRTAEIKSILLNSHQKLFADVDQLKNSKEKINFEQAFLQTISKQSSLADNGINAESLTMIRTRFILDWFETYGRKYPFKLFEYHRQLLREGMFDAYNQSIFGAAQNLAAYQNWTNTNSDEYNEFNKFQKGRIFKMGANQYYHK